MAKNIQVKNENQSSSPLERFNEMDRWLDSFFNDRMSSVFGDWSMATRKPLSQVKETQDAYLLLAELPGIPMKDIDIQINGNLLTVHAERKDETTEKEGRGFRKEFRSFHQSFTLPTTVDAEKVEAHCEDGVLEILLPKMEMAKSKRIEIQSGKGGFFKRLMGEGSQASPNLEGTNKKH